MPFVQRFDVKLGPLVFREQKSPAARADRGRQRSAEHMLALFEKELAYSRLWFVAGTANAAPATCRPRESFRLRAAARVVDRPACYGRFLTFWTNVYTRSMPPLLSPR